MSGRLKQEIKQGKPFPTLEVEAVLNIARTADVLHRSGAELLKSADVSPAQYNVLRILKGAGDEGMACGEIGERMIQHDPDITRMLDRMEERGWVARARSAKDRRVVTARITDKGARLATQMEQPLLELHRRQLGKLSEKDVRTLIELLESVRAEAEGLEQAETEK